VVLLDNPSELFVRIILDQVAKFETEVERQSKTMSWNEEFLLYVYPALFAHSVTKTSFASFGNSLSTLSLSIVQHITGCKKSQGSPMGCVEVALCTLLDRSASNQCAFDTHDSNYDVP